MFELDGVRYVVEEGRKGPLDLVLRLWFPGGGLLPMSLLAVGADFLAENEDAIHRDYWQDDGPTHLRKFLVCAMKDGYSFATAVYLKGPQARGVDGPTLWEARKEG